MHEHDHDSGGCGCGLDHDGHEAHEPVTVDAASESLSNALRLSFRLLSLVMVVVVGLFLLTGVRCASSNQVAVTKVLGKITGQSDKRGGLVLNWPYPVGEVQMVPVNPQTLTVTDFWRYETARELAMKDEDRRRQAPDSLRPGLDGALFTGDHNLLHAQFTCMYQIENPEAYLQKFSDRTRKVEDDKADPALDKVVRAAICRAAIHAAAVDTADSIYSGRESFIARVARDAQAELERLLPVGPGQSRVAALTSFTGIVDWPLRTQQAIVDKNTAEQECQKKIQAARNSAMQRLQETAGKDYDKLVGVPWEPQRAQYGVGYNLIGQYSDVRDELSLARAALVEAKAKGDAAAQKKQQDLVDKCAAQAKTLLDKIDDHLSRDIQGKVSEIMTKAEQDKANFIADVRKRENAFRSDLEVYKRSPELLLQNRWAEVRDQILTSDLVAKMYLTLGDGKTTIYINLDPNITKALNAAILKADQDKEEQGRSAGAKRP